mmetsp:Transcript_8755/g.9858  ORF Transcript_8755/g.9858 Transcript_8755/m.9858 type:complete len:216 (+) Transcript_8755:596-1243(+)
MTLPLLNSCRNSLRTPSAQRRTSARLSTQITRAKTTLKSQKATAHKPPLICKAKTQLLLLRTSPTSNLKLTSTLLKSSQSMRPLQALTKRRRRSTTTSIRLRSTILSTRLKNTSKSTSMLKKLPIRSTMKLKRRRKLITRSITITKSNTIMKKLITKRLTRRKLIMKSTTKSITKERFMRASLRKTRKLRASQKAKLKRLTKQEKRVCLLVERSN